MSNSEAPFSFTTKVDGDLFTIRGNDFYDFLGNLKAVEAVPSVAYLVALINGGAPATAHAAAVAVIQQAIPDAVVVEDYIQPAPPVQPAFAPIPPQPVAPVAPQAAAAGMACAHGPMKLMPAGVSKKTGKPYNAFYACQWPNRDEQCRTQPVA